MDLDAKLLIPHSTSEKNWAFIALGAIPLRRHVRSRPGPRSQHLRAVIADVADCGVRRTRVHHLSLIGPKQVDRRLVLPCFTSLQPAIVVARMKNDGHTVMQLADALGTTQRVISYYETEAELPPAATLIPLAQVLEVSTDELLGLEQRKPAGREHPQQQRLWKRFQKMEALPTKDQRAVIRLINSLAGSGQTHAQAS